MPERLGFEREIASLGLRESEKANGPKLFTPVAVGQRVELDLAQTAFAGKVAKVQWTIPGTYVRGYDGGIRASKIFKFEKADHEQPKISFFWVDAADRRVVVATIMLTSGAMVPYVVNFDVKGPILDRFTADTGVTQIEKRAGLTGMRFGKLTGPIPPKKSEDKFGIQWDWKITMPATHAGFVKDVQTVLNDRWKILRLKPGGTDTRKLVWRHFKKTDPHIQLDGHDGNEAAYSGGLHDVKIEAGKSFDTGIGRRLSDSPHTSLEPLGKTVSVNDQFTYFIMFKPATKNAYDAIWVPVAKAEWSWKATAKNKGGRWTVVAAKMTPVLHKTTPDFPMYESNAEENEWIEVQ